ncbi:DUF4184 family protein [Micromonospora sp. CPCC 206060]|uniref:DUF4184 family protein n=1 Tax=Micromonospora sp. CPCC 206060 TaxID=3122406 RepID=UPI002FF2F3BF
MPLTFPSHLAPVLPLKLWRPTWFDGVALVAGAVAPDAAYLAAGRHGHPFGDTHSWSGLLWWCLPVALCYTWVVRRYAGVVAVHLPDGGRFGWRRYRALSGHRYPWRITVASALLGAATHLGWDRLTHTDHWVAVLLGRPWREVSGIPWWTLSDLTSTVLGALVVIAMAVRIARHPTLLASGHPTSTPQPVDPRTFWRAAAVVLVAGLGALPFLPAAGQPAPTIVRLLHLAALALLVGGLATRAPTRQR